MAEPRRRTGPGPEDIGPGYVDPGRGHPTVYSQLPQRGWIDKTDDPWSGALGKPGTTKVPGWATGRPRGPQAGKYGGAYTSSLPDWAQGISLPGTKTLGKWYKLTPMPDPKNPGPRQSMTVQQTDIGPGIKGRPIDVSAAIAHQMGRKPNQEPEGQFTWEPTDVPKEASGLTDPVEQAMAVARARGMAPSDIHRQQLASQYERGASRAVGLAGDTQRPGMGLNARQLESTRATFAKLQAQYEQLQKPVRPRVDAPMPQLKPRSSHAAQKRADNVDHKDKVRAAVSRHAGSTGFN